MTIWTRRELLANGMRLCAALGLISLSPPRPAASWGIPRMHTGEGAAHPHCEPCLRVKVAGVGGGGCSALGRMMAEGISGTEFAGMDVDPSMPVPFTRLGHFPRHPVPRRASACWGDPAAGAAAAQAAPDKVHRIVEGCDLLFVVAGMGGGTGTGAAPVVARVAKEAGALTIGVVTEPFAFEGRWRRRKAGYGIATLEKEAHMVLVLSLDRLVPLLECQTVAQTFAATDGLLAHAVRSITELLTVPGLISVDFCDIRIITMESGLARMGIGYGEGGGGAARAARMVLASPMLGLPLRRARSVLLVVRGGPQTMLSDVVEAGEAVWREAHPEAHLLWGLTVEPSMGREIEVTVIATRLEGALGLP